MDSEDICKKAEDYIAAVRNMIHHEDMLANQRLTWMWTLQGLLFASVSFIWEIDRLLVLVIALLGIISCISIGYHIKKGQIAIKALLGNAREYKKGLSEPCKLPPIIGAKGKTIGWLLPDSLLPWAFGGAWILLIIKLIQISKGNCA